jgi:hypothetical protein
MLDRVEMTFWREIDAGQSGEESGNQGCQGNKGSELSLNFRIIFIFYERHQLGVLIKVAFGFVLLKDRCHCYRECFLKMIFILNICVYIRLYLY